MHILQLLPTLEVGGVERGVLDLAKGLLGRGHRVTVVSSGGALVEPLTRLGASHHLLPVHRKSPWSMWQTLPRLCRLIDESGIEVIHARSRAPAWIGYAASRRTRRPFVTTCHGFYAPHPASRVMGWGRVVVVPSDALGRYVIDRFRVPPERLRVIPRGVDLSEFQFLPPRPHDDGPWRIGLIGRLSALKGHEIAIRAAHQLLQHGHPVRLCFIGDAPARKPHVRSGLEQLARSLGVAEAIEWAGTSRDIPEVLRALDLVIAPSVYPESFGRSVIEAQAAGVAVIASRLGALAEIIDEGVTGLLVPPDDPTALAGAMERLLRDEPLRHRLIRSARERVEQRFGLGPMVDGYEAVYRDCVESPRVVVWKLSATGDFVLATPSLRAIRRRFPTSAIAVVVGRALAGLAARCPYVNDVILYDPKPHDWSQRAVRRVIRRMRQGAFDLSIDLQNSRLTHLMAWASDIPTRLGYDRRWGFCLSQRVPLPKAAMDPVSHQFELLRGASISPDGTALELWPAERDEEVAHRLLAELGLDPHKPLVGLHPGGSLRWRTKRWAPARWAALCDRLAASGAQVVMTGSASEQTLINAVRQLTASTPALAVGRTSLMELAALIRRCAVFVTHDSAPLHVAVAMGCPTVALFGPTDPIRHVPPSPLVRVMAKKVFCSPCYSPRCRTITHACMTRITVDEVFDTIQSLLSHSLTDSLTHPRSSQ